MKLRRCTGWEVQGYRMGECKGTGWRGEGVQHERAHGQKMKVWRCAGWRDTRVQDECLGGKCT